jgi:hypothetical protein
MNVKVKEKCQQQSEDQAPRLAVDIHEWLKFAVQNMGREQTLPSSTSYSNSSGSVTFIKLYLLK